MPMISSRRRKALTVVAMLGGALLAQQASAACRIQSSWFTAQDVTMDMGQIVILPSTPVGGVIKEISESITQQNSVARCDWSGGRSIGEYVNAAQRRPVAGFSNVYETDVAGVGIRLFRDSGAIQTYYPHSINFAGNATISLIGGTFRIQLIKTAAQTGSGVIAPNGRFTTYYFDGDGASRPVLTSTFKGSGTTVVSPTCEVQAGSRNIAVDFGSVPNTTFTGVGSRAVDRDFEIRLNCQGSNVAAYQSKIGIRLDADQDSSNMPGVLKLSAASNSATRIGIQMVQRDGTTEREVRFGQTINVGTTAPGTSVMALPLRARYVQTQAGTVGAGVANGQATFTIQYE
ncbi:TPA: type 1 fimbrial protein [Stenotrophomonas maltophilia]|uniref:Fimbrial protein n=1 Tax=Stenotrophomonas maltophilia TaxID=40324 RepID=A0A2J0UHM6_STEMA|nr:MULTISPECIES: fimbrial protein [Stenotrophomonas]PJL34375.1 fimbrial protein [Stenotrophomonas maltophilia]HDS1137293.1 type 1 fimbrial protein [Stenotrophomonas maltophilia]HDS1145680.1 type 1 fimbrial protein [Stenotrophomonas maltophilia]HDS1160414.1 type 1 fimbrial protein [Stenotrophomonas maltophilia]